MVFMAVFQLVKSLFPKSRYSSGAPETIGERRYETLTISTHDGREQQIFLDVTEVHFAQEDVRSKYLRDECVIDDSTDLRERVPDYVELSFCGWPPDGPNCLQLIGNKLFYDPRSGDGEQCCDVSNEQWEEIVRASHKTGIWCLPPDMENRDIIDGLQFDLKIKVGTQTLQSHGQLCDHPSICDRILAFHRTLQELTGWRPSERRPS
jgi:hypothetical protein